MLVTETVMESGSWSGWVEGSCHDNCTLPVEKLLATTLVGRTGCTVGGREREGEEREEGGERGAGRGGGGREGDQVRIREREWKDRGMWEGREGSG